jgi:hypothetical protein
MRSIGSLSIDFTHLSDNELKALIVNHKDLPYALQRVDGRAFCAYIILEERQKKKTPSKQGFIKPC